MSEKMYPIPFKSLMNWIVTEYAREGEIFGVHTPYYATGKTLPIFGETIETPFGPAAGPNSQLAQNIIAAYFAGARFFEVKTVQKMDGEELARCVPRPCILAADEGYNQEWSTELEVPQAQNEYIKAWCALKVLSKVYGLGSPDGFVFNMSVGYDLEGIKGEKVNSYIDNMMDASNTAQFKECLAVLTELFPEEKDFIAAISPRVSRSVTVSTLHGCPPQEIERIASYLLTEKGLHTFVKCNPTILGYKTARTILDSMGYDYIVFDEHHFNEDLQWEDAVPMFERLQKLADKEGLEFGLKLSNTFPVDTTRGELPNDEMYMSGRSLFPLTIEMCSRISRQFNGKMRISFAGGAEFFNCDKLFAAGIWPITVATTILKPGGYNRLAQMVEKTEKLPYHAFNGTDSSAISDMSAASHSDFHHLKPIKPLPARKSEEKVPLIDCFTAPCKGGCPIHQDIPEYMELVRRGLYGPALKLITEKNPLPFLTGTICAHRCQNKCSRNFYDESVHIRDTKLVAAENGYGALMASLKPTEKLPGKKAAIIGGGPTGIAAAYFLARGGVETTIFEREAKLGGVPRYVIPAFRISDEALDKDVALMERLGVEVKCGAPAPSVDELKKMGYTHILMATGAWQAGELGIPGADGMLFDLGVSSPQLDDAQRGFSYMHDAPLDMRMDRTAGLTARTVVNEWSYEELRRILYEYGEERYAPAIARRIVAAREEAPIETTGQLVELIKSAMPPQALREKQHPAKRSFQALRIAVNGELDELTAMLQGAASRLAPGGRLAVITFHSLEDRIVKKTMQELATGCTCPPNFPVCVCGKKPTLRLVNRKPIVCGPAELTYNPRARSAKLRVAEKL